MRRMIDAIAFLDQFWLTLLVLVPVVMVARAVVAGSRYSAILIIVVFGLTLGALLVATGAGTPGLPDLYLMNMLSRATIVALTASFFVGGQELRRLFGGVSVPEDTSVVLNDKEVVLGTGRTQFVFIVRSFFVLLGVDATVRVLLGLGNGQEEILPLLAYLGLVVAVILIDPAARVADKRRYLGKGVLELILLILVLGGATLVATWVRDLAAFPPIFFAMLIAVALGWVFPRWTHGPTVRALMFGGIPVVLAANFIIGGSLLVESLGLDGMAPMLLYGFFGQLMWMFGGISVLMLVGRTAAVRNLAPGMAGALSHAGLTGACTAGDMGEVARRRAPIMISVPFFGHVFLFGILAFSLDAGQLLVWPTAVMAAIGVALTVVALRQLRRSAGEDRAEVKGLMIFSFGWQLTALFGGLLMLAHLSLAHSVMATSAALSHFGVFAALQGGLFGAEAATLIAFVFAMPFLVHPFVYFMFGRGMARNGEMPRRPAYALAALGTVGVLVALVALA
ncbi:membrane protein [Cellulomonas bogoriensis 69B4 = DSM 16987]|uniref:Membrane protein n=2 Tax=Cellulomonas bogoriensis TaxID=301388 RepID=A0A0A0C266_9CELL|nr:membrane protein [Cellulomonas bogoriensis 69B4 = DSM 16987]